MLLEKRYIFDRTRNLRFRFSCFKILATISTNNFLADELAYDRFGFKEKNETKIVSIIF